MFVVWSSQLGGAPRFVPDAMALLSDPRARHFWDGDRRVGSLFETLHLDGDTLELSAAAWDTYLLFGRDAHWRAGSPPPAPAWWEHQLGALPPERRLDAGRFASKATELSSSSATASSVP